MFRKYVVVVYNIVFHTNFSSLTNLFCLLRRLNFKKFQSIFLFSWESYFELGDDHMYTFRDQFVVYSNFLIAPFHFHSHHNSSYNRCNLSLHNHIGCNSNIVSMFQKTTATSIKDHVEGPFWMQQRIICNLMGNSKTFEKYFDCTSF